MDVFLSLACETQACYENTDKERERKEREEADRKGESNIFSEFMKIDCV